MNPYRTKDPEVYIGCDRANKNMIFLSFSTY